MQKYFLLFAVLLGMAAKAVATVYYVDGASGSDGNAGTSSGAAWQTLGKASLTVTAGDTVYVKASATYNEILTFYATGTVSSPIRWEGYTTTTGDMGKVTIEGGNTRASCIRINNCNYNMVLNFILQGATSQAIHYSDQVTNIYLFNCRLLKGSATGSPASFSSSGFGDFNPTIIGCQISSFTGSGTGTGAKVNPDRVEFSIINNNTGDGLSIGGYRSLGPVRNNWIYGNGGDGIDISAFTAIEDFAHNTIHGNSGDGLRFDGGSHGYVGIANNLITSNGGYGINIVNAISGTTFLTVDKNFFHSNTSGEISNTGRVTQIFPNVTLTGSPYTSAAAYDFSLNSTAGAGAAVINAMPYNAWPSGTATNSIDGGAHTNGSSAAAATVMTISVGGL